MKISTYFYLYIVIAISLILYATISTDRTSKYISEIYTNDIKESIDRFVGTKKEISYFIYKNTINNISLKPHLKNMNNKNSIIRDNARQKIYEHYETKFRMMSLVDITQLQFHTPNNKSFLRMHDHKRYGDNLTEYRPSVVYVNKYKKPFFGYEHGRLFSGYRFIYPIVIDGEHHGSLEVSIDDNIIKDHFKSIAGIGVDIIFFDIPIKETLNPVYRNVIFKNYGLLDSFYDKHHNSKTIWREELHKKEIITAISKHKSLMDKIYKGEEFHTNMTVGGIIHITTFIPIKHNITNKNLGFVITYEESDELTRVDENITIFKYIFLLLLLTALLGFMVISSRNTVLENRLKDEDILTGMINRKALTDEFSIAVKHRRKITFAVISIDKIDDMNMEYGYMIGDMAIKYVSDIIKAKISGNDIIGKWSGVEFGMIIEGREDECYNKLEHIRIAIEESKDNSYGSFTCSIGATYVMSHDTIKDCIDTATLNLNEVKELGGNSVIYK